MSKILLRESTRELDLALDKVAIRILKSAMY